LGLIKFSFLSEYIGGGVYAELAAKLDDNDRHKKAQAMAAFRQQCDEQDTTDREIDELCEFVQATTDAMLLITGHHHHKRQWRKQRDHRKSIAAGV